MTLYSWVKKGKGNGCALRAALYSFSPFTRVRAPMSKPLRRLVFSLLLASSALPAFAVDVMELRAEQLLFAANDLKATLALSQNQQTLWQQSSGKASAILRARTKRRGALQAELKTRLADPKTELREMGVALDAETDTSAVEDKQLRELWLLVADGLTDPQRVAVNQLLLSQLERVEHPEGGQRGNKEGGPPRGEHSGGHKPGGMGGGQRP